MVAWTVSTIEDTGWLVTLVTELKIMVAWTVSTIETRVAQTVNTCEKANNMVAWTVSTIKNWVAQTVNTREKATNTVAWIVSTIENRVAPTGNTRERTTPVEKQFLTMKNSGNRMSPTVSKGKQQNMTIQHVTWHYKTDLWTAHNNPNKIMLTPLRELLRMVAM